MKLLSISQFRNNISKLINQVHEENETIILMKNGAPVSVILSVKDYNKLTGGKVDILNN